MCTQYSHACKIALRLGQILRGLHSNTVTNGNILTPELQIHALLQDQGDEVGGHSFMVWGLKSGWDLLGLPSVLGSVRMPESKRFAAPESMRTVLVS